MKCTQIYFLGIAPAHRVFLRPFVRVLTGCLVELKRYKMKEKSRKTQKKVVAVLKWVQWERMRDMRKRASERGRDTTIFPFASYLLQKPFSSHSERAEGLGEP